MSRKFSTAALFLVFIFFVLSTYAQSLIAKPDYLVIGIDSAIKDKILNRLDTLLLQIDGDKLDSGLINQENHRLTISILNNLKGTENSDADSMANLYKRQLINLYPVSPTEYFITIAYIGNKVNQEPVLKAVFNLIANNENGKIVFSIPTYFLTKTWQTKIVGNITYHFEDSINVARAKQFERKNISIAKKLGVPAEKFNFYLCGNYQQILYLLGYVYDLASNGETRQGYGVVANTIFSVMHHEDFSHDLFHYYASKVRTNEINGTAEEGIAYSWGNAYWTKQNGDMVTLRETVLELKRYLQNNPGTSLISLFDTKPMIFSALAKEISVRSVLSGLICDEVERRKGAEGIKLLLNCGSGADNYFKCINELIQINRLNFNKEVMKLIEAYSSRI